MLVLKFVHGNLSRWIFNSWKNLSAFWSWVLYFHNWKQKTEQGAVGSSCLQWLHFGCFHGHSPLQIHVELFNVQQCYRGRKDARCGWEENELFWKEKNIDKRNDFLQILNILRVSNNTVHNNSQFSLYFWATDCHWMFYLSLWFYCQLYSISLSGCL